MLGLSLSNCLGLSSFGLELFEFTLLLSKNLNEFIDLEGEITILICEHRLLWQLLLLKESLEMELARKIGLVDKLIILVNLRRNIHKLRLLHLQRDLEITKILV